MSPLLLGHLLVFVLSGVACLASVPRARRIQHPGTRWSLVGLLVSVAIWSGGYVGYLVWPTVPGKVAFYVLGFVFAFVAVGAWVTFCAAYTGRPPWQAPFRNAGVAVFLGFVALKVTNPLHGWYFTTAWTTDPFPHLAIRHELLYWIVLGLSYAVIAVGFFMLVERFYYTGTDSRPLVVLVGLTAVPAVATILGSRIDGVLPLMYEPPGVALFAVGTLFVYSRRFEAIRLTGERDEPAIFLDRDRRIRDYNQAARTVFPALEGSIGTPIADVQPGLATADGEQPVISVGRGDDSRLFEVSSTPFLSGDVTTGQLLTVTDVTDRETYRRRLEVKTEQLEALNRVVRHDIRNDMSVILGWAEVLEEHVDEDGRDALERVLGKSRHVIELTEVSREFVESLSGDVTAERHAVDLAHTLKAELDAVRDSFPDATFSVEEPVPDVQVTATEMLSSVFRNLLENAVRHSDRETPAVTVTVSTGEDSETVEVRIADDGPGIPDDRKELVFGKGERGLDSPGSGIGLSLVHTLVDQYGGDVWVEDNDPRGAVFVVELRRSP